MHRITIQSSLPFAAETVFAWHEQPEAIAALLPAFPPARVLQHEGIRDGALAVIELNLGLRRVRWEALHEAYLPGRQFRDIQLSGPFKMWIHTHRFTPLTESACRMEDSIQFELHGGRVVNALLGPCVRLALWLTFLKRHRTVHEVLIQRASRRVYAT